MPIGIPPFFQVSRSIREDDYNFLFSTSRLEITGFIGLWFLNELGPEVTKYVGRVTLTTRHPLPILTPLSHSTRLNLTLNVNARVMDRMYGNGQGSLKCLRGFTRMTVALLPAVESRCLTHRMNGHDFGLVLVGQIVRHLKSPCATPCESHRPILGDATLRSAIHLNTNMECQACMAQARQGV